MNVSNIIVKLKKTIFCADIILVVNNKQIKTLKINTPVAQNSFKFQSFIWRADQNYN